MTNHHSRVAYYGPKKEIVIYYTCDETQADGEVNVDVTSAFYSTPATKFMCVDAFESINDLLTRNDLDWKTVIANATLVTDEDENIIRDNRK